MFSYGVTNRDAYFQGENIRVDEPGMTRFDLRYWYPNSNPYPGRIIGGIELAIPGRHNILNALAAITVTLAEDQDDEALDFPVIAKALASFQGTGRRFELRGELEGVSVIDDYAHHPTAIKVTLEAARQRYPDRALWAVWQPHTYTRTQAFMDEYAVAFDSADHVLITDIYAARENPLPGVTTAAVIAKMTHPDARHTPTLDDTVVVLDKEVQAPAVILIMSAGDAPAIGVEFLKRRQERHANPAR